MAHILVWPDSICSERMDLDMAIEGFITQEFRLPKKLAAFFFFHMHVLNLATSNSM